MTRAQAIKEIERRGWKRRTGSGQGDNAVLNQKSEGRSQRAEGIRHEKKARHGLHPPSSDYGETGRLTRRMKSGKAETATRSADVSSALVGSRGAAGISLASTRQAPATALDVQQQGAGFGVRGRVRALGTTRYVALWESGVVPPQSKMSARFASVMRRTIFKMSSIQHGGAELPLCPKIGAAQQRRPTVILPSGLTR